MASNSLDQVDGAVAGEWIGPALVGGFGGHVKQQVPQVYEAYARIFHPASDEEGNEVSWEEVARQLGTTAHREMQWHAIVGSYDSSNFTGSRWAGGPPARAELEEGRLDVLCAILARYTETPDQCFFGLSTIHGGLEEQFADVPQLEMTHREYVVLRGPITAVDEIALSDSRSNVHVVRFYPKGQAPPADHDPPEEFRRQAPNLIWPEDRAWFFATEYDFDSTLVGGSRELIDAILAAAELEAWEVDGDVSLHADADKLNPTPEAPPGFDDPQDPVELGRRFTADLFESLSGKVVAASTDGGVLALEVRSDGGDDWRLDAENSDWAPVDVSALVGQRVEAVELLPETNSVRCRLSDGSALLVTPRAAAKGDPPSWRVELPGGMALKHMHHWPWLLTDFPDEREEGS
jgi:hypothetical protein